MVALAVVAGDAACARTSTLVARRPTSGREQEQEGTREHCIVAGGFLWSVWCCSRGMLVLRENRTWRRGTGVGRGRAQVKRTSARESESQAFCGWGWRRSRRAAGQFTSASAPPPPPPPSRAIDKIHCLGPRAPFGSRRQPKRNKPVFELLTTIATTLKPCLKTPHPRAHKQLPLLPLLTPRPAILPASSPSPSTQDMTEPAAGGRRPRARPVLENQVYYAIGGW
jgi:hypothetical protein